MKVIFNNSTLIFKSLELYEIADFTLSGLSSTATFSGILPGGDYWLEVTSSSAAALSLNYQYGAANTNIIDISPADFGKRVKFTSPENASNFFWKGDGNYQIKIYDTVAGRTKLGEVTMSSAYNNNKVMAHTNIGSELAASIAACDNVYLKVSDSNGLLKQNRGYTAFHYDAQGNTFYLSNLIFDCITATTNKPIEGNIYIQGTQSVDYTPTAGDTTIKVEFYGD